MTKTAWKFEPMIIVEPKRFNVNDMVIYKDCIVGKVVEVIIDGELYLVNFGDFGDYKMLDLELKRCTPEQV